MSTDVSVFAPPSFSSLLFSPVREERDLLAMTTYLHAKVTGARRCVCVTDARARAPRWGILLKLASPWHVFDVEAETGLTEDEVQG